jgi:site-specific DNA recombinase
MTKPYQLRNKKRAVGYARISSERQINGESPETQVTAIKAYAEREDVELVKIFYDEAKSGKNTDRAELQNMINYLRKHDDVGTVILYKMSRASRDMMSYIVGFYAPLQALGVSIRSATEPVDETGMGQFMGEISVLFAQLENHNRRDFTIDNMTSLAHQGYWVHPPLLGYDTHKIPNEVGKMRSTLKPNVKATQVKQVLERFAEGNITKAELTRYAKTIGLRSKSGKVLTETAVHKLIERAVYAGYVQDNFTERQLVKGKHEPIISVETYETNQRLLYGRRKRVGEVRQKLHPDYPLKGTILCPHCGKPMYASAPRTGSGGKSPRYDCSRPTCRGHVRSIKAVSVHDSFEELLERVQPEEPILELFREVAVNRVAHQLGNLQVKKATVNTKLATIADNRLAVIKKFAADKLTEEEKVELVDSYDEEKKVYTKELRKLEAQQALQEADIDFAVSIMRDTKAQWQIASPFAKQKFQSAMFPKGLVYDADNERFGTAEMSPLYRVLPNKKDLPELEKSFLVAGVGFEPTTLWL